MNKILKDILDSGMVTKKRTLEYYIDESTVAYVTEYHMNTDLGPMRWWCTWAACDIPEYLKYASVTVYYARARLYFPAFLDTRIPPENREGLDVLMQKFGLKEYDKFDFVIATKGKSPIKAGLVREVEPRDCDRDDIHAIEEIWEEMHRQLGEGDVGNEPK